MKGDVCFVTGASGFLGRPLLATLAARHPTATFRALVHRRPLAAHAPNVESVPGSLHDCRCLLQALRHAHTVIHLAASTHAARPEEYYHINAIGTERLVEAASEAGVERLVFVSSRAIRSECGDYARSKRRAEQAVRTSGIPHIILRLSEVYGPGSTEGLNALIALIRVLPLVPYPPGPTTFAPLFLDDAISALLAAADRSCPTDRLYTIAGPDIYTFRSLIQTVARTFALTRVPLPVPLPTFTLAAHLLPLLAIRYLRPDQISRLICQKDSSIEEARKDLAFSPIPFQEGLRRLPNAD